MEKNYRNLVEYYFELEYSDMPLQQAVEQVRVCLDEDRDPITIGELEDSTRQSELRTKWEGKVQQVVTAYYEADKPPTAAAQTLARMLFAWTGGSLLEDA